MKKINMEFTQRLECVHSFEVIIDDAEKKEFILDKIYEYADGKDDIMDVWDYIEKMVGVHLGATSKVDGDIIRCGELVYYDEQEK